jgi:threonine dehydrogenase-like Zn-dependent dehydrogenase
MKAAILVDANRFELQDIPVPAIKPSQVLVKVGACTVCATDIKIYKGIREYKKPTRMGHEITGTIAEVGNDVKDFRKGDRILSRIVWGGFAECVEAEARNLVKLPDSIGFEEGAIAQLLPIAVNGTEISVKKGDTVFISGMGPAGLLCLQTAKAYGASKLIVSDLFDKKLQLAKTLGADVCINAQEEVAARVRKETGAGADVTMECVGVEKSFRVCEEAVRPGGIISIFGSHLTPVAIDLLKWEGRSLRMNIMREQPADTPRLLRRSVELVVSGQVQLRPLLTRVMKLDQITEAFEYNIRHAEDVIKISIVP